MEDIKLYTDFEIAVDPNTKSQQNDGHVIQYGFPGSGSTFVWQVLNTFFPGTKKTHLCPDFHSEQKVVATVRDFRDILCTYFSRIDLPATAQSMELIVTKLAAEPLNNLYKVYDSWQEQDRIMWLKYEDFFCNFDYLFKQIETFFNLQLPIDKKEFCQKNWSLEANTARSKRADKLCNRDDAQGWMDDKWTQYTITGINGLHITANGSIGKWRRIIPDHLHDYANELLAEPLARFGYCDDV